MALHKRYVDHCKTALGGTRGPGALASCLVTCQIEQVRFVLNSHVATSYVAEVTTPKFES